MLKTLIISLLFVCLTLPAQTNKELRDSLALVSADLTNHPTSLELRLKKASFNLRLDQWEYACKEYDYILKSDPENITALYFRAFANEKLGKYNFSRADYEAILSIVPGHFESMLGLALLNQKDKHFTEALDLLNLLCSKYPNSSEAFAARAGVEVERGFLELAEYDFKEAMRLKPDELDYSVSHIDVLLKMNRKKDAKIYLDDLVKSGIPRPNLESLYQRTK